MASWQVHCIGGLILTWLILLGIHFMTGYFSFGWKDYILISGLILLFSLLPDIDHPISKITRVFQFVSVTMFILALVEVVGIDIPTLSSTWLFVFGALLFIGTFLVSQGEGIFAHRAFTHCWVCGIICVLPLFLIGLGTVEYIIGSWLGYVSHLVFDGIPLSIWRTTNH